MFKRKSTPPTISPLPPPQPSTSASDRRLSHLQTQPMQQQQQGYHSGSPVDRVGSGNYDNRSVKSDKRRSGFFGFGKKDKDKDGKGDHKEVCSFSFLYQSWSGVKLVWVPWIGSWHGA
jgi:hypothetical protein